MKNGRNRRFTVLLLLAAVLLLQAGCAYRTYRSQGTPEQAAEDGIKQAFLMQYVSVEDSYTEKDLSVNYIGRFNGFDAVYVDGVLCYTANEDQETVDGVTFCYSSGQHLLIYSHKDSRLYTLQQAFDGEVLDRAGLQRVLEAHRAAEPWMYKETEPEEETVSVVPTEEVADEDILRAFMEKNPSLMEENDLTMEDLSVVRIGVYDGCYAVWVNGPFLVLNMLRTDTVDGLDFEYSTSHTIDLYRDGTLYKLPEAWDAGLLSRAALEELHEAMGGSRRETE